MLNHILVTFPGCLVPVSLPSYNMNFFHDVGLGDSANLCQPGLDKVSCRAGAQTMFFQCWPNPIFLILSVPPAGTRAMSPACLDMYSDIRHIFALEFKKGPCQGRGLDLSVSS